VSIGDSLDRRANEVATAIGLRCGNSDRRFDDHLYAEFWRLQGTPYSTVVNGKTEWRTSGILQFTLYADEHFDHWRTVLVANYFKEAFGRKRWNAGRNLWIETEPLGIATLWHIKNGKRITIVDGGFDVWSNRSSNAVHRGVGPQRNPKRQS
jgi:hypothetical protein